MIYIILVNWNGWRDTIACLESILRSSERDFRVIVVDNGSQDGSADAIARWAEAQAEPILSSRLSRAEAEAAGAGRQGPPGPRLIIIEAGANLGFGPGNNVGIRYVLRQADCAYIWLLNNDTLVASDTLGRMLAAVRRQPGIVGSIIRFYADPSRVQAYGGGLFSPATGRVRTLTEPPGGPLDFINGASMMMDRATVERVGLFDERIFMYFEENDYCIRAARAGVAMTVGDATILHKGGGALGEQGSYFSWKNVYLNKIYVMKKHFGAGLWMLFSAGAWLINLLHPRSSPARRRASRDALVALCGLSSA